MPSVVGGDESDEVSRQDRRDQESTHAAAARPVDDGVVFRRAAAAGNVWICCLGVGAGSAELRVNDPDWRGSPAKARELFYHGLSGGQYGILGANVVLAGAAERARRAGDVR